eukprot:scaffold8557_cov100-Skeletonema_dohrnii-CCMP3373.AAC.3
MMEGAPPDIKRRRISAADGSPRGIRCLTDLPSGILAHTASFLAEPSKALFAVALDGNSAASPNERSSAIVGNQSSILDFGEIEKKLAMKLKDDDIEKVLLCIDAVNEVKRLMLTNCVNITGVGLEPLRGSSIIEQIDLSLVGEHQRPNISPEPQILFDLVLPILDSIIEREGCSLMHLQFPSVWREEPSTASEFHAFIGRYNQMRGNRDEISCLECNQSLPFASEWIDDDLSDPDVYGAHSYTCYGCMKHYCYSCVVNGLEGTSIMGNCVTCKRDYCVDCIEMHVCGSCQIMNCHDCYEVECHNCNEKICSECVEEDNDCCKCEDCNAVFCSTCNVMAEARTCGQCDYRRCNYCRLQKFRQGQLGCSACIKGIAHLLVDESKRLYQEVKQLKVENKEQQGEIKELERENKELKLDIKELRSRNFE